MAFLWPDMAQRSALPELMDDPACDSKRLRRSYDQLAIINRTIGRMRGLLKRHVLDDIAVRGKPAHILEVGCGGGDVLAWLAGAGQRRGLTLRLTGIDTDPRALERARQRLGGRNDVKLRMTSLFALDALDAPADYVFCNHVLHHIPDDRLASALRALCSAARVRLLVNDLLRSPWSYVAYTALAGVLFHRSYTFHDGRVSIRRGFRPDDWTAAARQAGLSDQTTVEIVFPGRLVLVAPGMRA